MAINLGNAEDVNLFKPEETIEQESVRIQQEEKQQEFLKPFLERFYEHVKCRVTGIPVGADIEKYIREINTIEGTIVHIGHNLRDIKEAKDGANEELYVFMDDFLEQAFYLHCAMELEYKKQEELKKQEEERLQEYDVLEAAKPIFSMLKDEVRKWNWGKDFDEYTISMYIAEMVELGKKHNVKLGIDKNENKDEEVEEQELAVKS